MIQFKYFHTSKGYVGRLSIGKDSRDYTFYNSVFDKIRSVTDGAETFAYATISSGTSVMMQAGSNAQGVFAHGIHIDSLGEFPCQYIDRLDRDIADPESVGAQLPDEGLPTPDFAPSLPSSSRLYQFIPKLIDALVYGAPQKRILIHTDDPSEAREFLSVLSAILPHDFMMRTGFCVGSKSINSTEIKIPRPGSQPDTVFIKIWIPKITNYRFETYANTNFVFDVESGRDNYTVALSTFGEAVAKAIETKGLGELKRLIDSVNPAGSPAFKADGSVDTDRLNIRSSNYLLLLENNPEVARKLLKTVNCSDAEQRSSAATAIAIIADNNPTSDDLAAMISLCAKSKELDSEEQAHDNLIRTMLVYSRFNGLAPELQKKGIEMIKGDDVKRVSEAWYGDNSIANTDNMCRTLYNLFFKFLAEKLEKGEKAVGVKAGILGYFGSFDGSRVSKKCAGEIIGELFENKEFKFRDEVLALLLASVRQNNTGLVMNDRISIVRKNLQKQTAKEQLDFIFGMRNQLAQLAVEFGEKTIHNATSFPFDSAEGEAWCKAIVGTSSAKGDVKSPISDSVEELVKLHDISKKREFESLTQLVFATLFNANYVKASIKSFTDPGYEKYRRKYKECIRELNESVAKPESAKATKEAAFDEADEAMIDQLVVVEHPAEQSEFPIVREVKPNISASAERARQIQAQADRASFDKSQGMNGKKKATEKEKLEKAVPILSNDVQLSDKERNNFKLIRMHLENLERKKSSKKFGMIANLSKAESAYIDFSDADKARVRRMAKLDEEAIEDIFCRDKKLQNSFVKVVKTINKEYEKARKNKEKTIKMQAKQAEKDRKAAAKKVEKSRAVKSGADRSKADRIREERRGVDKLREERRGVERNSTDKSQTDKKTRR